MLRFLKWLFLKPKPVLPKAPSTGAKGIDDVAAGQERLAEGLPSGIGPKTAERLFQAGFRTAEEVRSAPDEALLAIPGIGQATVAKLKDRASP